MKTFILALALVLGGVSGACAEDDHPIQGVLYGFADGGNRYESIIYYCSKDGSKLDCSFESKCLRFPNKNGTKNQDEFKKTSSKDRKKIKKEFEQLCKNIKKITPKQSDLEKLSEYDKEGLEIFNNMCIHNDNFEAYLREIDALENNVCRITTATWKCSFEKKSDGKWECSHIGDLLGGFIAGVKKATVQTFIPEKGRYGTDWNYTFEASYLGTPQDGKPLPEGYKDSYSWKQGSPILIPCKYVKMDIL